ncbi:unnamed protein product, partial [Urochloa humidicola]
AWTPLLYTDFRRDKLKGSLDVLWAFQMFLTNIALSAHSCSVLKVKRQLSNPY